jgi:hypothetical protein
VSELNRLSRVLQDSEHPRDTVLLLLRLSQLRAQALVGQALAAQYPLEPDWAAAMEQSEVIEALDECAGVLADVQLVIQGAGEPLTFDAALDRLQAAGRQHLNRAVEALDHVARTWNIPVHALITAILR